MSVFRQVPVPPASLSVPIHAIPPTRAVAEALTKIAVTRSELTVHRRLHEAYATRFNAALKEGVVSEFDWNGCTLHNLFWAGLEPESKGTPWALTRKAGEDPHEMDLVGDLLALALAVRGSGWACASLSVAGRLFVHPVQNHDYPWQAAKPLVLIDVWEHAYLSRLTDRLGYVVDLLRLVNWNVAIARLES